MNLRTSTLLLLAALSLPTLACDRDEPKREIVPAAPTSSTPANPNPALPPDHPPVAVPPNATPVAPAPPAEVLTSDGRLRVGTLSLALPQGWTAEPATGMRFATIKIPGITGTTTGGMSAGLPAGMSVMRLGGMGGGLEANLNRWRGQLGLPQPTGDQALAGTETIDAANTRITLVDFTSPTSRILGAIIPQNGETWFLKLQSDTPASLNALKPQLKQMLQSAQPAQ